MYIYGNRIFFIFLKLIFKTTYDRSFALLWIVMVENIVSLFKLSAIKYSTANYKHVPCEKEFFFYVLSETNFSTTV